MHKAAFDVTLWLCCWSWRGKQTLPCKGLWSSQSAEVDRTVPPHTTTPFNFLFISVPGTGAGGRDLLRSLFEGEPFKHFQRLVNELWKLREETRVPAPEQSDGQGPEKAGSDKRLRLVRLVAELQAGSNRHQRFH